MLGFKKDRSKMFIWLCAFVYFISYLTRNSYSSVIPEISEALNIPNESIGIVGTSTFLTYGAGQIICGVLGDRFSPSKMVLIGIGATALCNLSMPFICGNTAKMALLWGINGFAQAMFWPPLVRLMAERLQKEQFDKAVVAVTTASSIGNIMLYLFSPICIGSFGWKPVFFTVAALGAVTAVLWFFSTRAFDNGRGRVQNNENKPKSVTSLKRIIFSSGMLFILLAIFFMGMLRDGLATWMPSLVSTEYSFSNAVSVLTAVLLPVFAIIGIKIASLVQDKIKNELSSAAILYGASLLCSILLLSVFHASATASIALMALITAAMHGVNLILISRVPIHYARYGKISTVSGVLNAFTYIGSAASTYGFAHFSQAYGWYFIIAAWAIITALGTAVCLLICKRWKRFINE